MNDKRPLAGIRVVDMTSVVMGPFCTQTLGDMGADILKIEPPGGDLIRQVGPARHPGMGPLFLNNNRSKRSVALNVKHPDGRALLLELLKTADVFIYNVRPQAMARLGLDWETVSALNGKLIYAGAFGFGQDGPYAARPAYDDLIQAASGLASLFGAGGGEPRYVPTALADRIGGLTAVGAILAAYIEMQRSGRGQRVDIPMFETMAAFNLADHLGGLSFDPPLDQGGYARQLSAHRRPYRTRDGYVSALLFTDRHWQDFYRLIGRAQEFEADPRLQSVTARARHIDAIYGELAQVLATQTSAYWLEVLAQADIPVMPVHDLGTLAADEHLQAVGFFRHEQHPSEGAIVATRVPTAWSRTQPESTRPAPRYGEHTREVLLDLGLPPERVRALAAAGAIDTGPHCEPEAGGA